MKTAVKFILISLFIAVFNVLISNLICGVLGEFKGLCAFYVSALSGFSIFLILLYRDVI